MAEQFEGEKRNPDGSYTVEYSEFLAEYSLQREFGTIYNLE